MHRPRWSLMTYHPPKPKNPSDPAHSLRSEPHPHTGLPAQTSEVRFLGKNNQCLKRRPSGHSQHGTHSAQRHPAGCSCTPGLGALWAKAIEAPPRPARLPACLRFTRRKSSPRFCAGLGLLFTFQVFPQQTKLSVGTGLLSITGRID